MAMVIAVIVHSKKMADLKGQSHTSTISFDAMASVTSRSPTIEPTFLSDKRSDTNQQMRSFVEAKRKEKIRMHYLPLLDA